MVVIIAVAVPDDDLHVYDDVYCAKIIYIYIYIYSTA